MPHELQMIHLSGNIPVIVETNNGERTFWLNSKGIEVLQQLGADKFIEKMGETASKFLIDDER